MKEIEDLLSKAKRFLRTAELASKDGDNDSCVSRCYYAMFFATEALLLTKDLRASSHRGVIILFGEHFIKQNVVSRELGRTLRRAYDLRQKGDYATGFAVTMDEAEEMLREATDFVETVREQIQQ